MHRRLLAPFLLSALLLAACGGGGGEGKGGTDDPKSAEGSSPAATPFVTVNPLPSVGATSKSVGTDPAAPLPVITAGKKFGEEPTFTVKGLPPPDTKLTVISEGDGPVIQTGDGIAVEFKGQVWDENLPPEATFENTFQPNYPPTAVKIGAGSVIPAWDQKMPGVKVGSRVMLIAPPSAAFGGYTGNRQPPEGILAIDTLVYVIDVLEKFDPAAVAVGTKVTPPKDLPTVTDGPDPQITVPKSDAPKEFISQLLVRGKGDKIKKTSAILVHFRGVLWKNGQTFATTWGKQEKTQPMIINLSASELLPFWAKGVVGKPVGSRVLMVVPPDDGFGANGTKSGVETEVSGTDTLVVVADIIQAY